MAQLLRIAQPAAAQQVLHTSPQQSLEFVQTFISASFGCLTFLRSVVALGLPPFCCLCSYLSFSRGLFADDNFADERFQADPSSRDHVRLKLLRRGVSAHADSLLDWLEHGIYDALERKYLSAVVFAVYCDPAHPDRLHESYTFSVDYRDDAPSSLALLHSSGASLRVGVSPGDVRKNLQQLMRRFILLTQNLPPLPDSRYVSVQLIFDDSCPADYQPPGFRDASADNALHFAVAADGDSLLRESVGSLTTGWHALALNLSCLPERQDIKPSQLALSQDVEAFSAPRRKKMRVHNALDDIASPKWGIPSVTTRANAPRPTPTSSLTLTSNSAVAPASFVKAEDAVRDALGAIVRRR